MKHSTFDKKHWYDGLFYDKIIAPNQDRLFKEIKKIIEPDSHVIDIGCGTGRLVFQLASHCKTVVGVDLSSKNIAVAKSHLANNNISNISFIHGDATKIKKQTTINFDYAITTYVIHEMEKDIRINLLNEMKQVASKLILGDYIVPTPKTIMGKINIAVEFLAGTEHYNNFKTFVKNGGLNSLLNDAELKLIKEVKNKPKTAHLIVVE